MLNIPVVATPDTWNTHLILLELPGILKSQNISWEEQKCDDGLNENKTKLIAARPREKSSTSENVETEVSLPVGRLVIRKQDEKEIAKLFIGSKEITGSIVKLPRPILCCQVTKRTQGVCVNNNYENVLSNNNSSIYLEEHTDNNNIYEESQFTVYGIVREKILFEGRPLIHWKT